MSAILCAVILILPFFFVRVSASNSKIEAEWTRPSGKIYADFLNKLGLFQGSDKGFELEKNLNRDEAAVMIVRVLGKESEAIAGKYTIPFDDVDKWARPYVGWLYKMKITQGMSKTKFGSKNAIDLRQYLTFLMRSLGYSEAAGDFTYKTVLDFAVKNGFFRDDLTATRFLNYRENFVRFDCTELTFYALVYKMKQSEKTLADMLMDNKVFSKEKFVDALRSLSDSKGGYILNKDKKIIFTLYSPPIELPWLGISKESYASVGWDVGDFIIAFEGDKSNPYAVDKFTFERKSKLSNYNIGLSSHNLYNGILYFRDSNGSPSQGILKTYNWKKDEVRELLRFDDLISFNNFGGDKLITMGKVNGKFRYDIIDFTTNTVTNLFSEKAETLSAEYFGYNNNKEYSVFVVTTLGNDIHCYICDDKTVRDMITLPKKMGAKSEIVIFNGNNIYSTNWIAYVNNTLIKIGKDKKMTQLGDFSKGIASAFSKDDRVVYVLTGQRNSAQELGIISPNNSYTVLVPEKIMKELAASTITDVSSDGNVTFTSENEVGMMHKDVFTYVYNAKSKKIEAVSFELGRSDFEASKKIPKYVEEKQKMLDKLQQ